MSQWYQKRFFFKKISIEFNSRKWKSLKYKQKSLSNIKNSFPVESINQGAAGYLSLIYLKKRWTSCIMLSFTLLHWLVGGWLCWNTKTPAKPPSPLGRTSGNPTSDLPGKPQNKDTKKPHKLSLPTFEAKSDWAFSFGVSMALANNPKIESLQDKTCITVIPKYQNSL